MPPTSMVCPDCRNLISTEEKKCPYCGAYRPGLWGLGPALSRLFGSKIDVLTLIPTACIVLYVLSLLLDLDAALALRGGFFNMLSPGQFPMVALGMTYGNGPWWTLFTAIYLHGGLFHILFNVLWIRQLGPEVGNLYGPARYFIIFTTGGVVGFLLSNAVSGYPTLRRLRFDLRTSGRAHRLWPQPEDQPRVADDAPGVAMGNHALHFRLSRTGRQQLGPLRRIRRGMDRVATPGVECPLARRPLHRRGRVASPPDHRSRFRTVPI